MATSLRTKHPSDSFVTDIHNLIPPHVTEYLSRLRCLTPWSQWHHTMIEGGLNNRIWLMQSKRQKIICRLCTNSQAAQQSAALQQQMTSLGLSANIIDIQEIDHHVVILMDYIEGQQQRANTWTEQQQRTFAEQLATLHQSSIKIAQPTLNIVDHCQNYLQSLQHQPNQNQLSEQQLAAYQQQVTKLADLFKQQQTQSLDSHLAAVTEQPRLCHNDLNPLNIIYQPTTGRFVLLDWDEARIGDIFFDLAGFTVEHQLNQQQSHQWLEYYFSHYLVNEKYSNEPCSNKNSLTQIKSHRDQYVGQSTNHYIAEKLKLYQQAYRLTCELWHHLHQSSPSKDQSLA